MKKLFALTTLVVLLGSVLYAGEPLQNGVHAVGSSAQGIQVQGNDFKPWTASTIDLGSTELPFKNLELSGVATIAGTVGVAGITSTSDVGVTGDITASGDIRIQTFFGLGTADVILVTSATTITPTSSFIALIATAAVVMHADASDQIATSGSSLGDFLVVTTTEAFAFTFSEGDSTGIIGDATLAVNQYDVMFFILSSSDTTDAGATYWLQTDYQDN